MFLINILVNCQANILKSIQINDFKKHKIIINKNKVKDSCDILCIKYTNKENKNLVCKQFCKFVREFENNYLSDNIYSKQLLNEYILAFYDLVNI